MRLNTKLTTERLLVTFNFTKVALTVATPVIQVFDQNNIEHPEMVYGTATVINNRVRQLITGGQAGVTYRLVCTVNVPDTNEILVSRGSLLVQSTI